MHEIGIVRSMCRTVLDYMEENNVAAVSEIVCEVGELSLVIPQYVEELFPPVAEGTPLEGDDCDEIFNVIEHEGYCPNCGSFEKTVLTGKDFTIKEIHIPESN